MSSEYTIHLEDKPLEGHVQPLGFELDCVSAKIRVGGAQIILFVKTPRRGELARLLRKLAQNLAPADCPGHTECPCYQEGYEAERQPVGA